MRAISRKVPADKVKYALENLLRAFRANREGGENFGRFVDRHSDDALGAFLGLHLLAQDDPTWTPPPPAPTRPSAWNNRVRKSASEIADALFSGQ